MTKITNKDLIGDLKGFPIEVVEKILEHMKEQEEGRCALCWSDTSEGYAFWREIFWNHNFDLFYGELPEET